MHYPLLSICIPTYNRDKFLDECLYSLISQFKENFFLKEVEIVVIDNRSIDRTKEVYKKYAKKYKNIFYFENRTEIPIGRGIIEAGQHTKGSYIWFCSDDDIHNKNSLKHAIKIIKEYKPDVIYSNLDEYSRDMKTIIHENSLEINKEYYIKGRKSLFKFLNKKFFYAIDWYTAFYSNVIVNRKMYEKCYLLSKKFNSNLDLFPESLGLFYSKKNYSVYLIPKSLVRYRAANALWVSNNKLDNLIYWNQLLSNHYSNILKINNDVIPISFRFKLLVKFLIRRSRIIYIKLINNI